MIKVLRLKDVLVMIGISRSTLYDWMNPESRRFNGFPKPFKLGLHAVGWFESDVTAWIESRRNIDCGNQ
ncbi:AlpA family phage regulatory protein [Laribacter hongkongensis]|uniref:helix-turn-helix transcriptional regulator n=1 Tax=Laribacter hongkongensis TaxID=168471 RepID=UPI001EFE3182|nr:AlpA family phage regulatory protein [Laribacter hongkongensis]MCG8997815.1 AlpA family phage regulatory protein [Laribacter hongkongensis]MCG9004140.1 AlpA family phage regulatory protein [Laribacter hongkongensis]MCG9014590.1 AlpA family phage regulatory protein [Laribacter hongkongensis]MCG9019109.1 AlpA family phage regulatory protein [Laribacter hongkongensis]MCG9027806.1 AlpA family phage regulatory protein [Laribacter hongkongensis]